MKEDVTIKKPNIIWIFGDQHREHALGLAGDPNVRTPHLDLLSQLGEGRLRGIAGSPLCSPFRGSLFTGLYPHKCIPGQCLPLPDNTPTIATVLGEKGYRTAFFGKWHMGGYQDRSEEVKAHDQIIPAERRGDFEFWLGFEDNIFQWDTYLHGHDEKGYSIEQFHLEGFETDSMTDLFIDYIKRRGDEQSEGARPFFAALSVTPPHGPYVCPPKWMARHHPAEVHLRPNVPPVERVQEETRRDVAGYSAMVENLDWNVGRIVETLESTGLFDNTIIIFFSDHGDMLGSHGHVQKSVPWEESIRIPFIVGGSRKLITPHMDRDWTPPFVNHVDIAPTTLGLCGVDTPTWMEGTDYSGYLSTEREKPKVEPDSAYLQLVDPGYKTGFVVDRERPWRGVVTRDGWKYVVLEGQPWLMHNLNEDPYEMHNLAILGREKQKRKELQDLLADWMDRTGDTFQLPEISGS
ncbi:sulfatase [Candidatus Hydrogenedentota bacterium]